MTLFYRIIHSIHKHFLAYYVGSDGESGSAIVDANIDAIAINVDGNEGVNISAP